MTAKPNNPPALGEWQPIESLHLKEHCDGLFATSDTVIFSIYFKETGARNTRIGRVWAEKGVRSVVDTDYVDYYRVTHWMPLPNSPAREASDE